MELVLIAASAENVKLETMARGVAPYLRAAFAGAALLVAVPALSLSLPALWT